MNSTNYLMEIPKMQGYLQKQVNSFLNFWSTKYYTLDGIMLLSYSDNTLQTLEESISLDGCLVDGIWELEQRYCFTIRSLENQEQLEDFSAESQLEANQWVEKIKQAIMLSDINKQFKTNLKQIDCNNSEQDKESNQSDYFNQIEDEFNEHISDSNNLKYLANNYYIHKPTPLPNNILRIKQEALEINMIDQKYWKLIKIDNSMRIFQYENKDKTYYKAILQSHIGARQLASLINNSENDEFWKLYLKEKQLIQQIDDNSQAFYEVEELKIFNKLIQIHSSYIKFVDENNDVYGKGFSYHQINQYVDKNQFTNKNNQKLIKKNQFFSMENVLEYSYIKIEEIKCEQDKSIVTVLIKAQNWNFFKRKIVEKYIIEELVNLTVLNYEYDEIQYKIKQKAEANQNTKQTQIKELDQLSEKHNSFVSLDENQNDDGNEQNQDDPTMNRDLHDRFYNLDEGEIQIFNNFKEKYLQQGQKFNNNTYLRFLQARNFDVVQATELFDMWIKWKAENNVDQLTMNNFPEFKDLNVFQYIGLDFRGRPIVLIKAERIVPSKLNVDRFLNFIVAFLEYVLKQMKNYVDTYVILLDTKNIGSKNFDLQLYKKPLFYFSHYYCERQSKLIVLNTGFFARTCYYLLKPFLKKRTLDKLIFVSDKKSEQFNVLLQHMETNLIPVEYGGNNKNIF